jgi:hypothetical protein
LIRKYSSHSNFGWREANFFKPCGTGLTPAANSTNFGNLLQNRVQNMMKLIHGAIIALSIAASSPLRAEVSVQQTNPSPAANRPAAPPAAGSYNALPPGYLPPQMPAYRLRPFKADPAFTLLDILIYRPIGLAATLAGMGLFVGISPLTALASIPRPHDAFPQAFDILVNTPAAYTFVRPLGDRSIPYQYLQHY